MVPASPRRRSLGAPWKTKRGSRKSAELPRSLSYHPKERCLVGPSMSGEESQDKWAHSAIEGDRSRSCCLPSPSNPRALPCFPHRRGLDRRRDNRARVMRTSSHRGGRRALLLSSVLTSFLARREVTGYLETASPVKDVVSHAVYGYPEFKVHMEVRELDTPHPFNVSSFLTRRSPLMAAGEQGLRLLLHARECDRSGRHEGALSTPGPSHPAPPTPPPRIRYPSIQQEPNSPFWGSLPPYPRTVTPQMPAPHQRQGILRPPCTAPSSTGPEGLMDRPSAPTDVP